MSGNELVALAAQVDQYLAEADTLKYRDHQQSLRLAQSASVYAQRMGDYRRYAQALTCQAWAYAHLYQYESSLTRSLEILALARVQGFLDIEARILGVIGLNFLRCGVRQEAIHLFERQVALSEQLHDSAMQAMALNDLAVVKLEDQEMGAAIELLERALALMPPDTHAGLDCMNVHLNLAIAYIGVKRFDEGMAHAQHVLARATDAPNQIADAYLCLTEICLAQDLLPEAYGYVERARTVINSAVPPIYSVNLEEVAAELLMYEGRFRDAVQVWESLYATALERQEYDFAVGALKQIKTIYEQMGDTTGLISAYKRLAEDVPRLQKQGDELRFTVLRMVFAMDQAARQSEHRLTQQKQAILTRLSHEFRTPLAIIQGATEIVERYGEQMTLEQRRERLQRITAQVEWLTILLEDIVELLDDDENEPASVPLVAFDLGDLACEAMGDLERYRLSSARVHLQIQPYAGQLYGAQKSLRLVLVHLLTNALKFSQDTVTLELRLHGQELVMRVIDEGIGIRQEEQMEILKPLVRGSNFDEIAGTGLGLAIVTKLIDQIGGTFDLQSVEGEGTTVTIYAPVVWESEQKAMIA